VESPTHRTGKPALAAPKLRWVVLFCVLLTVLNAAGLGPLFWASVARGTGDFQGIYSGAELVGTGTLYEPAALAELHSRVFGEPHPSLAPVRIPAYYVFLRPFTWLDYPAAAVAWKVLMLLLLAGAIALQQAPRVATMGISACGATLMSLGQGQDLPLMLFALALFLRWRELSPGLAGMALCVAAVAKPHLVILLPLTLVVFAEWKILRSFAAGCAVAAGICFWTEGPRWLGAWLGAALNAGVNPREQVMPNLHGLAVAVGGGAAVEWIGAMIVTTMVVIGARNITPQGSFFLALLGSFLISHHAYAQDVLILAPGLSTLVWSTHLDSARAAALWVLSPLPFFLILAADTGLYLQLPLIGLFLYCAWSAFAGSTSRQEAPPRIRSTSAL